MLEAVDERINSVISDKRIFGLILEKRAEFSKKRNASIDDKFSELVFCTLTANTSAEMGLLCQEYLERVGRYDQISLKEALVECHYRFPNTRSRFIAQNHANRFKIEEILGSEDRRDLLIENYIGIGMKEASHYLRNIGFFGYSILDKHVQRFLSSYYSKEVRVKNKTDYEREEKLFFDISSKYGLEPGIMDLVIWYLMTGKILK